MPLENSLSPEEMPPEIKMHYTSFSECNPFMESLVVNAVAYRVVASIL
jgi:hypothetical protein